MSKFFFLFLMSFYLGFAQNPKSYQLKLNQFDYPNYPLPTDCELYGLSSNLYVKSVVAFDHRGEKIALFGFKPNGLAGGVNFNTLDPKLFSFSKHHTPEIPYANGFLLEMDITDVELFHEYTGKDNLYTINSSYDVLLSVSYKDEVLHSEIIHYGDVVGTFESALRKKDVVVVATNKAMQIAPAVGADIQSNIIYTFRNVMRNWIDLAFEKKYIKFFKLSKFKKLATGEQIKRLDKRLKNLAKLDEDIIDRLEFDTEVKALLSEFTSLIDSEDYKSHDGFKSFVHANMASLLHLSESFADADVHFDKALIYNDKSAFRMFISEERKHMDSRAQNKALLFDESGRPNAEYSVQYAKKRKTMQREVN